MKFKMRLTVLLVLSLTIFGSFAFADTGEISDCVSNEVIEDINIANKQIDDKIQDAIEKAELKNIKCVDDTMGFEEELDEIIAELINEANEIAQEAIAEAADKGVTVYCELIEIEIYDRIVWIDPLIVGAL